MATNPSSLINKRLSLISKLNIRYEGILYSVDSAAQAVALANVRSFGTEDREAEKFVPPSQDVYEFIIFRGSDIKDLVVPNERAPVPTQRPQYDPAIMASGAPGGQGPFMGFPPSSFGGVQPPQSFPYAPGSPYSNWGNNGNYFSSNWGGPNAPTSSVARPPASQSAGLEPPNLVPQQQAQPSAQLSQQSPQIQAQIQAVAQAQAQALQAQAQAKAQAQAHAQASAQAKQAKALAQAQAQAQAQAKAQAQTEEDPTSSPPQELVAFELDELPSHISDSIYDALEPTKRSNDSRNNNNKERGPRQQRSTQRSNDRNVSSQGGRGRNTQQQWKEINPTDDSEAETSESGTQRSANSPVGNSNIRGGYRGTGARGKGRGGRNIEGNKSEGNRSEGNRNVSRRRNEPREPAKNRGGQAIPSALFDLEASTAQFDKESVYNDINENLSRPAEDTEDEGAYSNTGFFDTLSCETLEKKTRPTREDWAEQRKIDTETFGSEAGRVHFSGSRRGGRGRGRAGTRGRGRLNTSTPAPPSGEDKPERSYNVRGRAKAKPKVFRPVQREDESSPSEPSEGQ
eukprot:TRINITY_DN2440_c0_g1_i1.p1 TRINITY_DN2440_c0_g1~~TRINITY_DN2440_c0_g1_i1.p1  ORF type:complete len:570 (-),score=120.03 TRINITY_DN2440_c0_g1_i1:64-1773(-)